MQSRPVQSRPAAVIRSVHIRPLLYQIPHDPQPTLQSRGVQSRKASVILSINRHTRLHKQLDNRYVALARRSTKSRCRIVNTTPTQRRACIT